MKRHPTTASTLQRRRLLALMVAAAAMPAALHAQPKRVVRLGWLHMHHPSAVGGTFLAALKEGLRELGYVEGSNLIIETRWAEGDATRLPALAAELVALKPDVIVTAPTEPAFALKHATASIPIVIGTVTDPVGTGLVASLRRPGGNITGLSNTFQDMGGKYLEFLLKVAPRLKRVGVLMNPPNPAHAGMLASVRAAADAESIPVMTYDATTPERIRTAFSQIARDRPDGLIVFADPRTLLHRALLVSLATEARVPTMFPIREFVEIGGLMSYGQNLTDNFRRAAVYVDKILKGANPGELPIEQTTHFRLDINSKTARALGLTLPQSLLLRADRIIE